MFILKLCLFFCFLLNPNSFADSHSSFSLKEMAKKAISGYKNSSTREKICYFGVAGGFVGLVAYGWQRLKRKQPPTGSPKKNDIVPDKVINPPQDAYANKEFSEQIEPEDQYKKVSSEFKKLCIGAPPVVKDETVRKDSCHESLHSSLILSRKSSPVSLPDSDGVPNQQIFLFSNSEFDALQSGPNTSFESYNLGRLFDFGCPEGSYAINQESGEEQSKNCAFTLESNDDCRQRVPSSSTNEQLTRAVHESTRAQLPPTKSQTFQGFLKERYKKHNKNFIQEIPGVSQHLARQKRVQFEQEQKKKHVSNILNCNKSQEEFDLNLFIEKELRTLGIHKNHRWYGEAIDFFQKQFFK